MLREEHTICKLKGWPIFCAGRAPDKTVTEHNGAALYEKFEFKFSNGLFARVLRELAAPGAIYCVFALKIHDGGDWFLVQNDIFFNNEHLLCNELQVDTLLTKMENITPEVVKALRPLL